MDVAMNIVDLDTALVSVPLQRPVITPIHRITTIDNVLVTLRTDSGLDGLAYLWTFGPQRARVLEAMVQDLFRLVRGRDARERAVLWAEMAGDINFLGRSGVAMFALSALDVALWDIAGKAADAPLWRLLGGIHRPCPVYAGGLFLSDSIDQIVAEARGYIARGFTAMKMRAGAKDWRDDIARVEAVRAAIGPDIKLMVDVVQGWTAEEAIRMGRELGKFNLGWIEDPVQFDDVEGLAKVVAALDTPIAAGENDYGKRDFRRLIQAGAIDVAMPDIQRVGGVTEWLKVAALAEAWNMPIAPHVFHEISVHLMAAIPNGLYAEHVPWWDVLFESPLEVKDGTLMPPSGPGLGLRFNEVIVDRYRVR
jgi:L-alanine-DL-glutamate epimerase-like enolase superfamily enzyme